MASLIHQPIGIIASKAIAITQCSAMATAL